MKKLLIILLSVIAIFTFAGCGSDNSSSSSSETSSSSSSSSSIAQDKKQIAEDKMASIDFDKLNKTTEDQFKNSKTYDMVKDISFEIKNEGGKKTVVMAAIVSDDISRETLLSLADSMIRSYGSNASMGTDLTPPSKDYYGEIFDAYDIFIVIVPASDPKHKDYVYEAIPAGAHTNIKIEPTDDFKG